MFLKGLHTHYELSAPLFRILLPLSRKKDSIHLRACLQIISTILGLDTSRVYANTPLTSVLKMFPSAEQRLHQPPTVAKYEPQLSSFSIANLAAPASSSSSSGAATATALPPSAAHLTIPGQSPRKLLPATTVEEHKIVVSSAGAVMPRCNIAVCSADDVLRCLLTTPPHSLERQIRWMMETAVECGKLGLIRTALTNLLIMTSSAAGVKTESKLPNRRSIALLLDWLQVIDPELQESPRQLRRLLLFTKYKDQPNGIGLGGFSQAYLLGAFTQQANWNTLEQTVLSLLGQYDNSLNPGGVLDFIYAVVKVPKLWQGRERRTPRHSKPPMLLQLEPKHLLILAQYIIGEKCEHSKSEMSGEVVQKLGASNRMDLLLQWYGNNKSLYDSLVTQLSCTSLSPIDSAERRASRYILYQLYLRRPCVLFDVSNETKKIMPIICNSESEGCASVDANPSSADVAIHSLITMISSPEAGRDFRKRLHDLSSALRTLASTHPLLLLRHFHLIHTGLNGLSHLHLMVLKNNNHLEVLLIFASVLELLHPHLFSPCHNKPLTATLDCYMNIFDKHGAPGELVQVTGRIVDLLHAWLTTDRPRALVYLVKKTDLLKSLSHQTKEWRPLAVAASSAPTHPSEPSQEEPTLNAPPLPQPSINYLGNEPDEIAERLTNAKEGEDKLEAWRRFSYFASRAPPQLLIKRFINCICEGICSTDKNIRNYAWEMTSRVLLHEPSVSNQFVLAVTNALQSDDFGVVRTACERIPDVVLTMHSAAPRILTAAFSAITTKVPNSLPSLTKAMTLLTIHTGA